MADAKNHPADSNIKNQILGILQDLRDKLTGDVLAFRHLITGSATTDRVRGVGFQMARLYSDKSFEHWSEQFSKDNKNWIACHHLAIMHHAKAFNLENAGKPGDAHHHWCKAQEFWKILAERESVFPVIHEMVKTLRHYKSEKHADLLDRVASRMGVYLLRLHERLAKVYFDGNQPQNAKYHLLAIKRSPFACAEQFYRKVYEDYFGQLVDRRIFAVKNKNAPQQKIAQRPNLMELSNRLINYYPGRTDTFPLARDMLRIDVWLFRIDFIAFFESLGEIDLLLKQKVDQLERLKTDIRASEEKLETGFASESEIENHNKKVRQHNRILAEHKDLVMEIKQKYKKFIPRAEKIENHLRELLNLAKGSPLGSVEVELREMIIECHWRQADEWEEYNTHAKTYSRLQQALDQYATDTSAGDEKKMKGTDHGAFELWPPSICANKKNPYAGTCFLLFGVEPPKIERGVDLAPILQRFRQLQRRLSNWAERSRLMVLERKITKADLNVVLDQIKKPEEMLRHILFQHQAHLCNVTGEEERLAQLPLSEKQDLQLKPTPAIYNYLPIPSIDFEWRLKPEPADIGACDIPEPDIEWPV